MNDPLVRLSTSGQMVLYKDLVRKPSPKDDEHRPTGNRNEGGNEEDSNEDSESDEGSENETISESDEGQWKMIVIARFIATSCCLAN